MSTSEKPTRPVSVIVVQILAVLSILVLLLGSFYLIPATIENFINATSILQQAWILLASTAFYLGMLLFLGGTFYGLQKRKPYGRWLAVGLVGLFLLTNLLRMMAEVGGTPPTAEPIPEFEMTNAAQRTGARMGRLLLWVGSGLILGRLIWGKRAQRFFSSAKKDVVEGPPAPPIYAEAPSPQKGP